MELPTVTVNNLLDFHSEHLPHAFLPSLGLEPEQSEDNDGLGYYPDGTKRTLTDEQIAIFRHSEIQDLIKRHDREIAREDYPERSSTRPTKPGSEAERLLKSAPVSTDPQQDNKEPGTSKDNINSEARSFPKDMDGHGLSRRGQKRKHDSKAIRKNNKPKREEFKAEGESRTYRRICRELDEHKSESIDLDY